MNGTIVKIVHEKGFGFLKPADGGKDVFFHATGVADRALFDELEVDDAVVYEIDESRERPRAVNVDRP